MSYLSLAKCLHCFVSVQEALSQVTPTHLEKPKSLLVCALCVTCKSGGPIYANSLQFHAVCVLASLANVLSGSERVEEVKKPELL